MTDQDFDNHRARLDHTPRTEQLYGYGEFYRNVVHRPSVLWRFRRWMKRPWAF